MPVGGGTRSNSIKSGSQSGNKNPLAPSMNPFAPITIGSALTAYLQGFANTAGRYVEDGLSSSIRSTLTVLSDIVQNPIKTVMNVIGRYFEDILRSFRIGPVFGGA